MAAQIIHDDDVSWLEGRRELLLDIGAETYAVDRPIEDTGRGKTVMAQRAQKGQGAPVAMLTKAAQASASWPQPRSGAMLVLIQVSSMKTRRSGSRKGCHARQRRAMSARATSRARSVFFEPQSFAPQEQPNCVVGHVHAARRQLILQAVQRQVRCRAHAFDYEAAMRLQNTLAMAAHIAGRNGAGRLVTLRPLHHR